MSEHLSCPVCGEPVSVGPPTRGLVAHREPDAFHHTADGRSLCPTPGDLHAPPPSWPDDHRPHHPGAVSADAVGVPARYPCRLWGSPRPGGTASMVVDRNGRIDCAGTVEAHGCPHQVWLAGRSTPGPDAGAGCWLPVAPAQTVFLNAYANGTPLPYRLPGFTRAFLDRGRAIALAAWFAARRERVAGNERREEAAMLEYVAGWLLFAAHLGGGIRVTRTSLLCASAGFARLRYRQGAPIG